ncbi:anti-sigma-V factor rsiV [Caproiciproducens galactitolivorans]|uniref:Anti-sigma-V factor RsiV n=1 Tax=Caproiciproducens galactitolivorans TaxID=642589 RepID=A0A4Z0YGD9_9FIRM|nr:anti-sigma-V factor rsiV [Caproiciproducens galactitolivorans]QEY34440.1 anti-sigma-V factor rsiV [Caproiciproducens galactitolivorans]TGJ77783.1 anti-sigma-V factor RsiV [Caproiciproducens galactitolivorans]
MRDQKLDQLKKEYMDTPIPQGLDALVRKTLRENGVYSIPNKKVFRKLGAIAASIAIVFGVFVAEINSSPAFAKSMEEVPVVGNLVKVLTFREYTVKDKDYEAEIKVPQIQGLKDKKLENSINEKYLQESKKLYEKFMAEMQEMKKAGAGHKGVYSSYEVKTDNDTILSVGRSVLEVQADSYERVQYDTIDKKKQVLLTLPSLFKDDQYIQVISDNIKKQMREQMKKDQNVVYWLDDKEIDPSELFKQIKKDQSFYINKDGKLVIAFNQFDVAPGYMGAPEFTIPTDVLSNLLVGNEYIH